MTDIEQVEQTAVALCASAESVKKLGAIDSALDLKKSTDALEQTMQKLVETIETMTAQAQSKADQTIHAIGELTAATALAAKHAHNNSVHLTKLAKMQAHATRLASWYDEHDTPQRIFLGGGMGVSDHQQKVFDLAELYGYKAPKEDSHGGRIDTDTRIRDTFRALNALTIGYTYNKQSYKDLP